MQNENVIMTFKVKGRGHHVNALRSPYLHKYWLLDVDFIYTPWETKCDHGLQGEYSIHDAKLIELQVCMSYNSHSIPTMV